MIRIGKGTFFDGATSARIEAVVELETAALIVRAAAEGHMLARWPYGEIEHLAAPEGLLRLGRAGTGSLARLEVRDHDLAHAIDERAVMVDRTGAIQRRGRLRVVGWTLAAVVSLVMLGIYGVPALADRIAPLVPHRLEHRLGQTVDAQVRAMLDTGKAGKAFECGDDEVEKPGRAALDRLTRRFEAAAGLPIPLHVVVVRRKEANAIALPGGHVYVFEGLITKAETADEVAGVIAHEIGHVAHRDGTRSILQTAGVSFLFGMLLGDFVGGGAVVLAAKTVLSSSYSRDVEAAADRFGTELMAKTGGDPRALGTILTRIAGANHPGMKILLDHPDTKERVAAIEKHAPARAGGGTLLAPAEWSALKRVCAGR